MAKREFLIKRLKGILEVNRKKTFWAGLIVLAVLVLYYCGGNPGAEPKFVYSDPSFMFHIQPILTNNCALYGCHNSTAKAGLILLQGPAYINLVNVSSSQVPGMMRVLPGDAANSYLIIKIEGNQTTGTSMPQAREALDEIQTQNIKNWIIKGAKDN